MGKFFEEILQVGSRHGPYARGRGRLGGAMVNTATDAAHLTKDGRWCEFGNNKFLFLRKFETSPLALLPARTRRGRRLLAQRKRAFPYSPGLCCAPKSLQGSRGKPLEQGNGRERRDPRRTLVLSDLFPGFFWGHAIIFSHVSRECNRDYTFCPRLPGFNYIRIGTKKNPEDDFEGNS